MSPFLKTESFLSGFFGVRLVCTCLVSGFWIVDFQAFQSVLYSL